jgi:protoporphyrinogen oxidase
LRVETLIVGGGITGLAAASFLKSNDFLVLERDETPGGYCKTTRRNGFVWDYSGHFFHFKNPEIKDYVLENVECEILSVNKITDIDYKGKIIDFPFQHNIHQLSQNEYEECLSDLSSCELEDKRSFKTYIRSTLGNGICEKFLIPYNEKLYACDLDTLDHDSMGRFFPKKPELNDLLERKNEKSYNDTFMYPINGSYEYVKSILRRVDESKIHRNCEVQSFDLVNRIAYTSRGQIEFKNLINTLPFDVFLRMSGHHHEMESNKVAVFNLGFDRETEIKSHWRYFPGDEVFYRVGFYNNILSDNKLSLYVEIGLSRNQTVNVEELKSKVLDDLKRKKIITDHKLVDWQFLMMNPAYVHITSNSKKIYEDWSREHNPKGMYSIGRYGSWTYCSIEDNIIEAKLTIEKLNR